MIGKRLPYAKGGETSDANRLVIWDLDRNAPVPLVTEASADEGWYRQIVIDIRGRRVRDPARKGHALTRRVEARIEIILPGASEEAEAACLNRAAEKRARKAARLRAAADRGAIAS